MWGPGLVGTQCWAGRPSEGFGRPGGEGWLGAPFSPPDSVSSLEHCWAFSGLCPLALGCIALCLQLNKTKGRSTGTLARRGPLPSLPSDQPHVPLSYCGREEWG